MVSTAAAGAWTDWGDVDVLDASSFSVDTGAVMGMRAIARCTWTETQDRNK
jgi:hypothetical protein